jgi:hypothetical protein
MKKILYLPISILALASCAVTTQPHPAAIVVVKVSEDEGYLRFAIARGDGKTEMRDYVAAELSRLGGTPTDGRAEATRQLFAELFQQGYVLTCSYGGGDRTGTLNTLVFTKRR